MIILIDNYDSFTFNLYQYIGQIDEVKVVRNDEITIDEIKKLKPRGIVISPGPGRPEDAGISVEVAKTFGEDIPVLGICLGHQAIAVAYGANVIRANEIYHGKSSQVMVKGNDIFEGVSRKIEVMRYHSLVVDRSIIPKDLEIIGETVNDHVVMAIKHKTKKIYGIQFHPESVFTPKGMRIIRNFVEGICYGN